MKFAKGNLRTQIVGAIFIVVFVFALVAFDSSRSARARRMEGALDIEIGKIEPPQGASLTGVSRMLKGSVASVTKRYVLSGEPKAVIAHFGSQLAQHGWTVCGPTPLKYCKGDLRASLEVNLETSPELEVFVRVAWYP